MLTIQVNLQGEHSSCIQMKPELARRLMSLKAERDEENHPWVSSIYKATVSSPSRQTSLMTQMTGTAFRLK